jgi:hypothetical protein
MKDKMIFNEIWDINSGEILIVVSLFVTLCSPHLQDYMAP